jgi:Pregnancy-associated plasma protein-A/Secretion system C-terminal sorting domain
MLKSLQKEVAMRRFFLCLPSILVVCTLHAQRNCYQTNYSKQLMLASNHLSPYAGIIKQNNNNADINTVAGANDHGVKAIEQVAVITIPVVVHILWNQHSEDIPDAQIRAQIASLNKDFSGTNADNALVPAYFKHLATGTGIQFALARIDETEKPTTGIIRKWTTITGFGFDDRMKYTELGGSTAWNPDQYLNVWVCTLQSGVQGYASSPGSAKETDGVVIANNVFGMQPSGPFNKGRTATHEIGHWLGLQHIWGDDNCGDDNIDDTPPQYGPTRGCPSGVKLSCGTNITGDMYMNFMDFTDDACMCMFTNGQREHMRSLFEPVGARNALLFSPALNGPLPPESPLPSSENATLQLFPNPAINIITIRTDDSVDLIGKTYRIFNFLGQVVGSAVINNHQQKIIIAQLPDGIYYIQIDGLKNKHQLKFVKQ